MEQCSKIIGRALDFLAFSAHARRPGASIPIRAGRIVAGTLLSLSIAVPARAADMPLPGPAPVPPNSYYPVVAPLNWGGIYFGVNGGYAFGNSDWNNSGVSTGNFTTSGGIAGGTAGINFAGFGGGFLFGVEGDVDWSSLKGSSSTAACVGLGAAAGTTCQTKSGWLSTARARAGYAIDHFLIFGTAGAAIADLRAGLIPQNAFISLGPQIGWTVGGGVEYAFTENWTAKVEYLYVGLGTIACPSGTVCSLVNPAGVSNPAITTNENLVRVGFNYKFAW
jgi:outer membrane immunogenic protein